MRGFLSWAAFSASRGTLERRVLGLLVRKSIPNQSYESHSSLAQSGFDQSV